MTDKHGEHAITGERRLGLAVAANMILTLGQVIGGILSGSLSLIADALHNFSDAASLLIALVAVRISKKPPDELKTFGYRRAETIAALINLTTLIIIGLYLVYEAFYRFYSPQPIEGWIVVMLAGVALVVDIMTALLTYSQSKQSMNIKAAFLHNVSDALASVGVMIAGTLIIIYGWIWTDAAVTLLISGYVLWQGFTNIPEAIHLLMEGTPEDIEIGEVIKEMERNYNVKGVHHLHIWRLDENRNALEAHVVLEKGDFSMEQVKYSLKKMLHSNFAIEHSTLEFEKYNCKCGTSND